MRADHLRIPSCCVEYLFFCPSLCLCDILRLHVYLACWF
jgi:hypothetical protein